MSEVCCVVISVAQQKEMCIGAIFYRNKFLCVYALVCMPIYWEHILIKRNPILTWHKGFDLFPWTNEDDFYLGFFVE